MKKITLTTQATVQGYEGAFYRYTTDEGKASIMGIYDNWYAANGRDEQGNEYLIVWAISNREAFDNGDEDCCDWDEPSEVLNLDTGLPETDYKIVW